MTKVDLIAKVAAEAELTKKDAEKAVAAVLDGITEALKAGDKVCSCRLRHVSRPASAPPAKAATPARKRRSRSPLPPLPLSRPARL